MANDPVLSPHIPIRDPHNRYPSFEVCDTDISSPFYILPPLGYATSDFKVVGTSANAAGIIYVDIITGTEILSTTFPPKLNGDTHWNAAAQNNAIKTFVVSPDGQHSWVAERAWPDWYVPHYAIRENYDRVWKVTDVFGTPTFNLVWSGSVASSDFLNVFNAPIITTLGTGLAALCYTLSDPHIGPFVEHILVWNSSGTLTAKLDTDITYTVHNPGHTCSGCWANINNSNAGGNIQGSLDGLYLVKSHPTNPNVRHDDDPTYSSYDGFEVYTVFTNGAGPTGLFGISGYELSGGLRFLSDGRLLSIWMNSVTKAYYLAIHPAGENPLTSSYEWIDLQSFYQGPPSPGVTDTWNSGLGGSIAVAPDLSYILVNLPYGGGGSGSAGYTFSNILIKAPFTGIGHTLVRRGSKTGAGTYFLPPVAYSNEDTATIEACINTVSNYSLVTDVTWGVAPYTFTDPGGWPVGITLSSNGTITITNVTTPQVVTKTIYLYDNTIPSYTPNGMDNSCTEDGYIEVTINIKLCIGTTELNICQNTASTAFIETVGGTPPYTYTTTTTLPSNLVLNTDGTITGQTSIVGTTNLDIKVVDDDNNEGLRTIPLIVGQKAVLNYTAPDPILVGDNFNFNITAAVTLGTTVNWTVTGADWLTQTISPDTTVLNLEGTSIGGIYPITVSTCVQTESTICCTEANLELAIGTCEGIVVKINSYRGLDTPYWSGLYPWTKARIYSWPREAIFDGSPHTWTIGEIQSNFCTIFATPVQGYEITITGTLPNGITVVPNHAYIGTGNIQCDYWVSLDARGNPLSPIEVGSFPIQIEVVSCTNPFCRKTIDLTIIVVPRIKIEQQDLHFCLGEVVDYQYTITGGIPPYQFFPTDEAFLSNEDALEDRSLTRAGLHWEYVHPEVQVAIGNAHLYGTVTTTHSIYNAMCLIGDSITPYTYGLDGGMGNFNVLDVRGRELYGNNIYGSTEIQFVPDIGIEQNGTIKTTILLDRGVLYDVITAEQRINTYYFYLYYPSQIFPYAPFTIDWEVTGLPTGLYVVPGNANMGSFGSNPHDIRIAGITTEPAGDYNLTVTATSNFGCNSTSDFVLTLSNLPCSPLTLEDYIFDLCKDVAIDNIQLVALGGIAPYTFTVLSTLPTGILISSSGVITGTHTVAETSTVSIRVTDSTGTPLELETDIYLIFNDSPNVSTVCFVSPLTVGVPVDCVVETGLVDVPVDWLVTNLPAGLTTSVLLPSYNLQVIGTPTTVQVYSAEFTATVASNCFSTLALDIDVTDLRFVNTNLGLCGGDVVDVPIEVSGGTLPYIFTLESGTLPAGLTFNPDGTITGTVGVPINPVDEYILNVTVEDSNNYSINSDISLKVYTKPSLLYTAPTTVEVNEPISFNVDTQLAYETIVTWTVTLPVGLDYTETVVDESRIITVSGALATTGIYPIYLRAETSNRCSDDTLFYIEVTPINLVLVTDLFNLCQNTIVSTQLEVTGGTAPYTFEATSTPPGTISVSTSGLLTGTIADSGVYNFDLTITDSSLIPLTLDAVIEISVTNTPSLSTNRNTPLIVGVYTAFGLIADNLAEGTVVDFIVTNLPPGLIAEVILPETRVLVVSGTPTFAGLFNVEVTATVHDTGCVDTQIFEMDVLATGCFTTQVFDLEVLDSEVIITINDNLVLCQDKTSTLVLEAAGGVAPYTYTTASTLPTGLTLNIDGTITGSASETGTFVLDIFVEDSVANSALLPVSLLINQSPIISYVLPPYIVKGVPFSFDVTATLVTPEVVYWEVLGLPAWAATSISLDTLTLTISGTPTETGILPITINTSI